MQNFTHTGLTSIQHAANQLIQDFVSLGFTPIYTDTTGVVVASSGTTPGTVRATFDVPSSVDSIIAGNPSGGVSAMPWRVAIHADYTGAGTAEEGVNAFMRVYMGTPEQLLDDGSITLEYTMPTPPSSGTGGTTTSTSTTTTHAGATTTTPGTTTVAPTTPPPGSGAPGDSRLSGELSSGLFYPSGSGNTQANLPVPFFCYDGADFSQEYGSTIADAQAHPISTSLTVTKYGVAFFIWLEGQYTMGNKHSWFCVQRLVDPNTGNIVPLTTASRFPLFCLYSVGGGEPDNIPLIDDLAFGLNSLPTKVPCIYKMVVRELDINRPSMPVNACLPSPDQAPVINAHAQVSIYEDQTFSLTMPSNFNTDRYKYKEQMDMVLYTSANVISPFNTVVLNVFGRNRTYTAMLANLPDNTGMRMLMLTADTAV